MDHTATDLVQGTTLILLPFLNRGTQRGCSSWLECLSTMYEARVQFHTLGEKSKRSKIIRSSNPSNTGEEDQDFNIFSYNWSLRPASATKRGENLHVIASRGHANPLNVNTVSATC